MILLANQLNELKQKNSQQKEKSKKNSDSRAKKDLITKKSINLKNFFEPSQDCFLSPEYLHQEPQSTIFKKSDYLPHSIPDKRGDLNLRMNLLLPRSKLKSQT